MSAALHVARLQLVAAAGVYFKALDSKDEDAERLAWVGLELAVLAYAEAKDASKAGKKPRKPRRKRDQLTLPETHNGAAHAEG